jgi:hypothetical protein
MNAKLAAIQLQASSVRVALVMLILSVFPNHVIMEPVRIAARIVDLYHSAMAILVVPMTNANLVSASPTFVLVVRLSKTLSFVWDLTVLLISNAVKQPVLTILVRLVTKPQVISVTAFPVQLMKTVLQTHAYLGYVNSVPLLMDTSVMEQCAQIAHSAYQGHVMDSACNVVTHLLLTVN